MTGISIFRNDVLIAKESIKHEYYIVEAHGKEFELYWFENDPGLELPYQIRIWIQSVDSSPTIMAILPEWSLVINQVEMEKKLYMDYRIKRESDVELKYKDYRFVFNF